MTDVRSVRIQRSRAKGWRLPEDAISVCRPGPWGNPFKITPATESKKGAKRRVYMIEYGSSIWFCDTIEDAAKLAVDGFKIWINQPQQRRLRELAQRALRGHDLACWCPLVDKDGNRVPCHADVLIELANAPLYTDTDNG